MEDEPGVSRHTRGRNNARQSRLCPPSSSPSARPYVLTFSLLFISHVFKLIFKGTMSQILIRKGHNFYASYQCILRQDFGCCLISIFVVTTPIWLSMSRCHSLSKIPGIYFFASEHSQNNFCSKYFHYVNNLVKKLPKWTSKRINEFLREKEREREEELTLRIYRDPAGYPSFFKIFFYNGKKAAYPVSGQTWYREAGPHRMFGILFLSYLASRISSTF